MKLCFSATAITDSSLFAHLMRRARVMPMPMRRMLQKLYAAVNGFMHTTARAPTARALR